MTSVAPPLGNTTNASASASASTSSINNTSSSNNCLTPVPDDLDSLPKDALVRLLKRVATERNDLIISTQARASKKAKPAAEVAVTAAAAAAVHAVLLPTTTSNSATAAVPASVVSILDVTATKKHIASTVARLVKKKPHNSTKKCKPWTEIIERIPPTESAALQLFAVATSGPLSPKSNTKQLMKWTLMGAQVSQWLNMPSPYIHRVKYDPSPSRDLLLCFYSANEVRSQVYAWAQFEKLDAKFEKKTGLLTLRFQTKWGGSGKPEKGCHVPPSLA